MLGSRCEEKEVEVESLNVKLGMDKSSRLAVEKRESDLQKLGTFAIGGQEFQMLTEIPCVESMIKIYS